ncbi:hypothetical protein [Proteiniborus sp. MB09-C3]|uniref:hypothetical protein n=1 Tax=Proteiniborus sp. MB09-C3 TaxID=3050072 RepID=UPI002554D0D0|nr:hypothetical protein [Proteiniborus sp. MB09-C3]WIV13721.1 hypothetical protein QO263_08505 [Proteiniborus sp. MB09-C3]
MSSFFDIISFEYKKLFKRKSTMISLFLLLVVVVFLGIISVSGASYWHSESGVSAFEAMKLDREVIRSKAGLMDVAFIKEAIEQNAIMIANDENYIINDYGRYLKGDAYIKYVLPYKNAVNMLNIMYEVNTENLSTDGLQFFNMDNVKPIDTLTVKDAESFYATINQASASYINSLPNLSQNEKGRHIDMLSQVKIPYYNDHYDGYLNFYKRLKVIALILMIVIAICISPIFANEYYLKTDQIILSSKYGKSKVISAKLFTGVTFSLSVSVATLFGFLLLMLLIHGFSGANMAIQTIAFYSTYPLTILQASLVAIVVTVFVILFFGMLTMLFSSWFKSPFFVITMSFLLLFIPGLFNVSHNNRLIYQILQIFPAKATEFSNIYSKYLFEILGFVFIPATFYIIFSLISSLLIIPLTKRAFKNHQIE